MQDVGAKALEESLPLVMQAMWQVTMIDMEKTLRHVCKKVLADVGVPPAQRLARAAGLKELAKILREAALRRVVEKEAEEQAAALAAGEIAPGAAVTLRGLKSKPELNGTAGVVAGDKVEKSGRWPVLCELDDEIRALKPENLEIVEQSKPAGGAAPGRFGDAREQMEKAFINTMKEDGSGSDDGNDPAKA